MNKYRKEAKAARKRVRELIMCGRKRRYPSETKARQKGMKVYHCPYCDGWHRATPMERLACAVSGRPLHHL
jgi:hypothetical protein